MGSQAATTYIKNIRVNIGESIADSLLTDATSGSQWTNSEILEYLNKAKNRAWELVKGVREEYFLVTGDTSIALLASTKEYSLPADFRQIKNIKVTTSGYEYLEFRKVDIAAQEFIARDREPSGAITTDELIYDIIGTGKIKFADYPPASLATSLDYVKFVSDFTLATDSALTDINDEWREFIEAYATMLAVGKNAVKGDTRLAYWTARLTDRPGMDGLETKLVKSVSKRDIRGSEYVEAFSPF